MMSTIKITTIISGVTLIIGICIGYFIFHPAKPGPKAPATITTISGAPMSITKENYSGKDIKIDITATGEGESEISIPKSNIPEVFAWQKRIHSIELDYYMLYSSGRLMRAGGISYYYRWNRLEIGGGPIVGANIYGFRAGVKYLF
jgi:hypothetical protein